MEKNVFVTMGDPNGIGMDLVLLTCQKLGNAFNPQIIGLKNCFEKRAKQLGVPNFNGSFIEPDNFPENPFENPGKTAIACLDHATLMLKENPGLLLTCPINKNEMKKAGFKFPGHTEYLAHRAGVEKTFMIMAGKKLNVILTTVHEPLKSLPNLISQQTIEDTIKAAIECFKVDFKIENPKIGVAGLNPHAGENGNFGDEEQTMITPAIENMKNLYPDCSITGPQPPDTIFWEAVNGKYDIVVCMYHDQGLIAAKTIDFFGTVNFTWGLPYVRTSPDHGTAFDLVGTGKIDLNSFINAWNLGKKIVTNRENIYG
jgi:4-hydroxythreonine-4-phosphate dehydrogenase